MSPDEQEAKSLYWGGGSILLLPLTSGRWALFDTSHQYVETLDSLEPSYLRRVSTSGREAYQTRRSLERRAREVGMKPKAIEETLEELGL